jgi:hypothetical protein
MIHMFRVITKIKMESAVFWDVTTCGCCKNRGKKLANVIPSSPILVTLLMEKKRSSKTFALTRATRRNIPEDGIIHGHSRQKLKSYISLMGWAL